MTTPEATTPASTEVGTIDIRLFCPENGPNHIANYALFIGNRLIRRGAYDDLFAEIPRLAERNAKDRRKMHGWHTVLSIPMEGLPVEEDWEGKTPARRYHELRPWPVTAQAQEAATPAPVEVTAPPPAEEESDG